MEKLKAMHADRAQEMAFIKYVEKHFDVRLENEPETDADYRKEFADCPENIPYIKNQLAKGNRWAWCMVSVSITIGGQTATDYLGACSYRNQSEFKSGGYYSDMLLTCLEELYSDAKSVLEKIAA